MDGIVGVTMMVGLALMTTVGLGLAVVGDLEDTRRPIVAAHSQAVDQDGDGYADGERFYMVQQGGPGRALLEVQANGEDVGQTHSTQRTKGVWVPCQGSPVSVDTTITNGDVQASGGSFTVPPCQGLGNGSGGGSGEECGADLCEDPPLPECPLGDGDTVETNC